MQLESWITQLVEEPFVRLFAGRMLPQEVAQHLARAMEDGERLSVRGTPEVPGRYRIVLNPDDLAALTAHHPDLDEQLAAALKTLTARMHVHLREPPVIILQPDPRVPLRSVHIVAAHHLPIPEEETRDISAVDASAAVPPPSEGNRANATTPRAYLIIEDNENRRTSSERIFDLTHPVIRIGRALDNDLILEGKRVSRHHAQLRRRYGRYILQDLGSSSGVKVNGFSVQECVLRPGDIIALAGVNLIYATDATQAKEKPRRPQDYDTQPMDGSTPSTASDPHHPAHLASDGGGQPQSEP